MWLVFLLLHMFVFIYFLFKNRNIDFYFVAFVGVFFYFLPGLFGEVGYLSGNVWLSFKILPETYFVMILVDIALLSLAVLNDRFNSKKDVKNICMGNMVYIHTCVVFTVFFLFLFLYMSSGSIFSENKSDTMMALNRWHTMFYISCMIGLTLSATCNSVKYFIFFFVLLMFNLYIGFRSPLVISLISWLVVYFRGRKVSLYRYYKLGFLFLFFILFLFFYKYTATAFKYGNYSLVLERLFSLDTYILMIVKSEPFVVLNNLNEVLKKEFFTPSDHIISSVYNIIFFAPELGANISSFNSYFQSSLFSEVDYGLASNFWAQFWSVWNWLGLLIALIIYSFILLVSSRLYQRSKSCNLALISPAITYFSFYIHRNDLGYVINLSKRVLVVSLIFYFIYMLIPKRISQ